MKFIITALLFTSASAFASSACVTYVDNSSSTVEVQASCDGAALATIFTTTGMTAGISKAIQHFMDQGYTFVTCSEAHSGATQTSNGNAYSRCTFIRK